MAELLVAEFLLTFRLNKRNYFILRMILTSAFCMVAAIFFPVPVTNAFYSSVLFLCLLGISFAALMVCYKEKPFNIFYCAIAAYTVRHFSFQLFSLFTTLVTGTNSSVSGIYDVTAADVIFDGSFFLSLFTFICCYFIVYTLFFTLFGPRISKNRTLEIRNPYLLILVVLILFVDIVLNAVVVYNFVEDNFLNGTVFYTSVVVLYIYNMLCCLFSLFIQFTMIDMTKLKKDLEIVNHLWQQEREQYELAKDNIDLINLKCHDLKYQIRQITQSGSIDTAMVKELENIVSIYDAIIKTGNEALDVIFTEKSLFCQRNNIKLNCMIDGARLSFVDKTDIYVLFGNLVDNAIEAVQKLADVDKRIISMNICAENQVLAIHMSNYYSGEIVFSQDGLPATTKSNKNFHGLGMKSIFLIVEKYDGNIELAAEEGIFSVDIVFPIPKNITIS